MNLFKFLLTFFRRRRVSESLPVPVLLPELGETPSAGTYLEVLLFSSLEESLNDAEESL